MDSLGGKTCVNYFNFNWQFNDVRFTEINNVCKF